MEENKKPNPYSIVTLNAGDKDIMKLQYNGLDMLCPYKSRIPMQRGKISADISLAYQECGSICPHFEFIKEKSDIHRAIGVEFPAVALTCGGQIKIISVQEPKQQTEFVIK